MRESSAIRPAGGLVQGLYKHRGPSLPPRPPGRWRPAPARELQAAPASRQRSGGGQPWGNANRLSSTPPLREPPPSTAPAPQAPGNGLWASVLGFLGKLQYQYYKWRQDTWSDLQLFMVLNTCFLISGAGLYGAVIRNTDSSAGPPSPGLGGLWGDLYSGVLSVVLGSQLPPSDGASSFPSQCFAVAVSVLGLTSFALVLALTEQVVLEVLERNVRQGSAVYEKGHVVVLAWCQSEQELSQLQKILSQLCEARRVGADDCSVAVVLTQQREKLEMESIMREAIPLEQRYGLQFVFRQGSPLDPASLRMVGAPSAKAIILSSDYSRPPVEADALVVRAAVLLDEMCIAEHGVGSGTIGQGPVAVAQVHTDDGLDIIAYTCSARVIPVPTTLINVRRFARFLRHPIAAVFSHMLTDYSSEAHACLHDYPQLLGLRFDQLHTLFDHSLVIGVINKQARLTQLNPPAAYRLREGDSLLMLRPGTQSNERPLQAPMQAEPTLPWDPAAYVLRSQDMAPCGTGVAAACYVEMPKNSLSPAACNITEPEQPKEQNAYVRRTGQQSMYVLPIPLQYNDIAAAEPQRLLIAGWSLENKMWELLKELDHGVVALPAGSRITLAHNHTANREYPWTGGYLEEGCRQHQIRQVQVEHVKCDPRQRSSLAAALDVSAYKAAIVVCDSMWAGQATSGGPDLGGLGLSQSEMLRLDADVLLVQLNIRKLLDEKAKQAGPHPMMIIVEKSTYLGLTRFEDTTRLPLGVSVNLSAYAAKALTHTALQPFFLDGYAQLGRQAELFVQDSSVFAAEGEEISFLALQARAALVNQVLLGYYRLPGTAEQPLEVVVNPQGVKRRMQRQVFNSNDGRCKLVTFAALEVATRSKTGSLEAESMASSDEQPASAAPAADAASRDLQHQ